MFCTFVRGAPLPQIQAPPPPMPPPSTAPGEICDEWSDDEDGPIIRVRWLFTASQVASFATLLGLLPSTQDTCARALVFQWELSMRACIMYTWMHACMYPWIVVSAHSFIHSFIHPSIHPSVHIWMCTPKRTHRQTLHARARAPAHMHIIDANLAHPMSGSSKNAKRESSRAVTRVRTKFSSRNLTRKSMLGHL